MQTVESTFPEAEDLKRDRKAPQRSCIVTREPQAKEKLIRFVLSPEGILTPDLAGKLPGRGYWVSCQKQTLQQAIEQKRFVQASKGKAQLPDNLLEKVQKLLSERALQFMALATKSGALITGFDKIADALAKDSVIALIHAEEASPDSVRKLPFNEEKRFRCFPEEALSAKLKSEHAVHCALLNAQAGRAALKEIQRFTGFLQSKAL